ncbi:hypothetical protein MKEN_00683200 [Mycena kentingensis (nom. inval.)]|nr:hypothetical protein MKEN_00683200 [Mycena kentingensis (nom. inval.)]
MSSVQSHLSSANSQQRLRASAPPSYTAQPSPSDSPHSVPQPARAIRVLRTILQLETSPDISWRSLAIKWMLGVYCVASLVFSTTTLYTFMNVYRKVDAPSSVAHLASLSPLDDLSATQRLSRLTIYSSATGVVEPYVLTPLSLVAPKQLSACLWMTDSEEDMHDFMKWAQSWNGPISVLVVTKTTRESSEHIALHLLHADARHPSPAAYLNLARLFALSDAVLLLPAHPSKLVPPPDVFNMLQSSDKIKLVTPTTDTLPPLVPAILPKTAHTWCSERLSFLASRESDWNECIWQMSLDENGSERVNASLVRNDGEERNDASTRLRDKLSGRLRAEACEAAIRFWPSETRISKGAKRRFQRVKNFCRQVSLLVIPSEETLKQEQHRGTQ